MKKIYLLPLLSLLVFFSCKPDKVDPNAGDVKFNFKATFNSNPLVVFNDYLCPDGDSIEVHVFNFFISHVDLVKENNEVVRVKLVDYIDFNANTNINIANSGITKTYTAVPPGNYKEIRFGIGIEPGLNSKDPGDYPSDPYLGDPGNYWASWNSFIFSRIEGRLDTAPGQAGGNVSYLYHAGVDGMYKSRTFAKSFNVSKDLPAEIDFVIDVKDVFYRVGSEVNIPVDNVSHSAAAGTPGFNLANLVIGNIANAITIQ